MMSKLVKITLLLASFLFLSFNVFSQPDGGPTTGDDNGTSMVKTPSKQLVGLSDGGGG
ncbi:hypothetical protein [Methylomonas koyamae]|uniref:hypothetical protein n=1 Tax=Methylomonas koyamae TaxID=702114 RepID=UPI001C804DF6|nr:hypothetical protein [Methylomonas koyamae]